MAYSTPILLYLKPGREEWSSSPNKWNGLSRFQHTVETVAFQETVGQFLSECLIFKLWPANTSSTSTERGLNSLGMKIQIPSMTLLLWLSWLSEMAPELSLTVSSITLITVFFLSKHCFVFHIDCGKMPKVLGRWIIFMDPVVSSKNFLIFTKK